MDTLFNNLAAGLGVANEWVSSPEMISLHTIVWEIVSRGGLLLIAVVAGFVWLARIRTSRARPWRR